MPQKNETGIREPEEERRRLEAALLLAKLLAIVGERGRHVPSSSCACGMHTHECRLLDALKQVRWHHVVSIYMNMHVHAGVLEVA